LKKIRSDFLTEYEAMSALEKIRPYCRAVDIIYDDYIYDEIYNDFFDFPEINSSASGLGFIGLTNNNFYNYYNFENRRRGNLSGHVALEADVADDNFEYVKEKLYSLGALSVM